MLAFPVTRGIVSGVRRSGACSMKVCERMGIRVRERPSGSTARQRDRSEAIGAGGSLTPWLRRRRTCRAVALAEAEGETSLRKLLISTIVSDSSSVLLQVGGARQPAKRASLNLFRFRRAVTFSHTIELRLDSPYRACEKSAFSALHICV